MEPRTDAWGALFWETVLSASKLSLGHLARLCSFRSESRLQLAVLLLLLPAVTRDQGRKRCHLPELGNTNIVWGQGKEGGRAVISSKIWTEVVIGSRLTVATASEQ